MAAIFGKIKFFENWHGYSAEIPCGQKFHRNRSMLLNSKRYKMPFVELFLDLIELAMSLLFFKNYTGFLSLTVYCLSTI